MGSFEELFPGRFLKAADFGEKSADLTIEKVFQEVVDGKPKAIVKFKGKNRKGLDMELVLVRTNAEAVALCLGSREVKDWIGKVITLHAAIIANPFKNRKDAGPNEPDTIPAIRVKGSPDLTETRSATIKRGRKEIHVTVIPTGRKKPAPAAAPAPTPAAAQAEPPLQEPPEDMVLPGGKPDPDAVDI